MNRLVVFGTSPIESGAVCAMLAAIFVDSSIAVTRSQRCERAVTNTILLALATVGIIGCGLSGSRGPTAGLVAALMIQLWMAKAVLQRATFRRGLIAFSITTSFLLFCLRHRGGPNLLGDGSIANRLEIYRAGPKMLTLAPFWGLGPGEAGYCYSQWFQPYRLNYIYHSVYNEWLQLALERGLLLAWIATSATLVVLGWPAFDAYLRWRGPRTSAQPLPGYSAFIVFTFTGLTSVISNSPLVVFLVFGSAMMTVTFGHYRIYARQTLIGSSFYYFGVIQCFLGVGVLVGYIVSRTYDTEITSLRRSHVVLSTGTRRALSDDMLVLVDQNLMGKTYGREIRQWVHDSEQPAQFIVLDPRRTLSVETPARYVVCIGAASEQLGDLDLSRCSNLLLVNPTAPVILAKLPPTTCLFFDGVGDQIATEATIHEMQLAGAAIKSLPSMANSLGAVDLMRMKPYIQNR